MVVKTEEINVSNLSNVSMNLSNASMSDYIFPGTEARLGMSTQTFEQIKDDGSAIVNYFISKLKTNKKTWK